MFNTIGKSFTRQLASRVLQDLEHLGAYVYCYAKASSSVYIKFNDSRLRSLRIGDHPGRSRYRYKWNLRTDVETSRDIDGGVNRYYYHVADIDKLIDHIDNYAKKIGASI